MTTTTTTAQAVQPSEQYHKLGRKALYLLVIQKSLVAIFLFIIEIALLAISSSGVLNSAVHSNPTLIAIINGAMLVVFLLFIIAFTIGIMAGYFAYISFRYKITENGFSIERGIASKTETSLPYHHIENVEVEQSVMYRLFGLCDLIVLTTGRDDAATKSENESKIALSGIDVAAAHALQEYLLSRANVQEISPAETAPAESVPPEPVHNEPTA